MFLELPGVVIKRLLPGGDALPNQESPQVHHGVPGPHRQGHHQVLVSQVHLDVVPLPSGQAPAQRVHPLQLSRAAVAEQSIQRGRDVALKRAGCCKQLKNVLPNLFLPVATLHASHSREELTWLHEPAGWETSP